MLVLLNFWTKSVKSFIVLNDGRLSSYVISSLVHFGLRSTSWVLPHHPKVIPQLDVHDPPMSLDQLLDMANTTSFVWPNSNSKLLKERIKSRLRHTTQRWTSTTQYQWSWLPYSQKNYNTLCKSSFNYFLTITYSLSWPTNPSP